MKVGGLLAHRRMAWQGRGGFACPVGQGRGLGGLAAGLCCWQQLLQPLEVGGGSSGA